MAWNPSPEVAVAREAAKQLGANTTVVIFTRSNGQFGAASYGKTLALCAEAGKLCDHLFEQSEEWLIKNWEGDEGK